MFRAVISLIVIVLLLLFASQNMEHAQVYVLAGTPARVPLILIMAICFVLGYATAILSFIFHSSRKRRSKPALPVRYER